MKKILVCGPVYGHHNIGDEAILESIILQFSDIANISVITADSEWIEKKYPNVERIVTDTMYSKRKWGLTASPRRKLLQSFKNSYFPNLKFLNSINLMICGGGTILSECPWHSLHWVELARKKNVPVIIWGAGMASVDDIQTRQYIKKVCNYDNVKYIYCRDEFTAQRIKECGVEVDKIGVCYDPVFALSEKNNIDKYLTESGNDLLNGNTKKICISLSGEKDIKDNRHIEVIKKFIEQLPSEKYSFFLLPTGCGEHCKDREYLRQLLINDNVAMINSEMEPSEAIYLMEKMDLIISSRLHCTIFGAISGIPSIGIIRSEKQTDFARLFGLPTISFDCMSVKNMVDLVDDIFSDYESITKEVNNKAEQLKFIHLAAVQEVKKNWL